MPVIDYNTSWMIYNSFLALIAVLLGFLVFKVNGKFLKLIIGLLWFIFLPNTIYIFTDLEHFIVQWQEVSPTFKYLLLLQYVIFELIGILTFLLACSPLERVLNITKFFKKRKIQSLIVFNFLVAFGMVLGRVERLNSWDIFFNPHGVITSAKNVLFSVDLLGLTVLFGLLCNFIYFLFRDKLLSVIKKFY